MNDRRWTWLRGLFLVGFAIALPLFAYPPLTRWADRMVYGAPKPIVPPLASPALASGQSLNPVRADAAAPGAPSPAEALAAGPERDFSRGIDAPFAPPPSPPLAPAASGRSPDFPVAQIGAPIIGAEPARSPEVRLQDIRQQLEDLGAKSLVLEMTAGDASYRFACEMFVAPQSAETRSFVAVTDSPLAAAEQVLREVSNWRVAQVDASRAKSLR